MQVFERNSSFSFQAQDEPVDLSKKTNGHEEFGTLDLSRNGEYGGLITPENVFRNPVLFYREIRGFPCQTAPTGTAQ